MKSRLFVSILLTFILPACSVNNHETQTKPHPSLSPTPTGKTTMFNRNPMFNEILNTTKGLPPGVSKDVSNIVVKYIPIGISREHVKEILAQMNQDYTEIGNTIQTGYLAKFIPMVPRASIAIHLKFNESNFLEKIDAKQSYQQ